MQGFFWKERIEDNYVGHILAEIYKDGVYKPFLEGKENLVIVDIGANIGLTGYYFSQFASKVYSIEPSKEHFECMQKMIEFNQISNIVPINVGILSQEGEFDLFHNQNRTMFSFHTAIADRNLIPEKARVITLPTLFKEQNIEHVDFMKLDVEGSEQEILGHSSFSEVAPKIDSILLENHSWNGRHPNQLKEALKNRGFIVEQIPNDASLVYAHKWIK